MYNYISELQKAEHFEAMLNHILDFERSDYSVCFKALKDLDFKTEQIYSIFKEYYELEFSDFIDLVPDSNEIEYVEDYFASLFVNEWTERYESNSNKKPLPDIKLLSYGVCNDGEYRWTVVDNTDNQCYTHDFDARLSAIGYIKGKNDSEGNLY